jgi:RNA polymerase sigma-70 factor (ECF subfamily)
VARNIVTNRIRARVSRPHEVEEPAESPAVQRDHAQTVVESMTVLRAMDGLSPEHREVLVEIHYLGRTVAEAAEFLGVAPGTVKSRSYYALRALRATMSSKGTEVAR